MSNAVNLTFLSSAGGQMTSEVYDNSHYSLAVFQVSGSFTGVSIVVEGRVDPSAPWEPLDALDMRDLAVFVRSITRTGIFEVAIDGIAQIRLYVASIAGGTVTVTGVLYDSSDNSVYPGGSAAIRFGDPSLFVKGVAEQIYMDPSTGNILGYDRVASNSAVTMSVNLTEITGGMTNKLLGVIPDTTRLSGTYTSAAFSLETRRLITGGQLAYNAICPFCETITAESGSLTVSNTPVRSYVQPAEDNGCWCYVSEKNGGTQRGDNYFVNPETKEVENFYAEIGKTYEVTYYIHNASALGLTSPSIWNPVITTIQTRYAVYGKQGKNEKQGVLRGWLYFVIPRAILNANSGVGASQTGIGETDGSWIALTNKRENMPYCSCDDDTSPIAYYAYVPCGDETVKIRELVVSGGGMTIAAGKSARLALKLIYEDDAVEQPDYSKLNYSSSNDSVATVNSEGYVYGESAGSSVVTAYFSKGDGSMLSAACSVTVTGTRGAVTANPNNITIV